MSIQLPDIHGIAGPTGAGVVFAAAILAVGPDGHLAAICVICASLAAAWLISRRQARAASLRAFDRAARLDALIFQWDRDALRDALHFPGLSETQNGREETRLAMVIDAISDSRPDLPPAYCARLLPPA